jgi:aminopeptidase N
MGRTPWRRRSGRRAWTLCAAAGVLLVGWAGAGGAAAEDPRIDAATARDLRAWPAERSIEVRSAVIELEVVDPGRGAVSSVVELEVVPLGSGRERVELDAGERVLVDRVTVDGAGVRFTHDAGAGKLRVELGRMVGAGESVRVQVWSTGEGLGAEGAGLVWVEDDPATAGADAEMVAVQGTGVWLPSVNETAGGTRTELSVTVPEPYEVVAAGSPASLTRTVGKRTYRFVVGERARLSGLGLAVGVFEAGVGGGVTSGINAGVVAPAGLGAKAGAVLGRGGEMVAFFEELFGEPLAWTGGGGVRRVAQVVSRSVSGAGGAVVRSGVVVWPAGVLDRPAAEVEREQAEALARQWFGGVVWARSEADGWVMDTLAGLGGAMWVERQRGREAYLELVREAAIVESAAGSGRLSPLEGGLTTRLGASGVGDRGARCLAVGHMLRTRLGDAAFVEGVRAFVRANRFADAETDDFRVALEGASGQSLERFFDQWVHRPGSAVIEVEPVFIPEGAGESAGVLRVKVRQTQVIDAENPAYAVVVPLVIETAGGTANLDVPMHTRETETMVMVPGQPTSVRVDPEATVLGRMTVREVRELGTGVKP